MIDIDMIRDLTNAFGPSGFEEEVVRTVAGYCGKYQVENDAMNNLYVRMPGRAGDKPVVQLDAHLDEIGFVVTGHEEGYLKFAPLGGVDPRMLPDRELTVLTDPPLAGVVACLPPHVQTHPGALPGCGAEPGGGGAPGAGGHPGGLPRGLLSSGAGADLRQVPG